MRSGSLANSGQALSATSPLSGCPSLDRTRPRHLHRGLPRTSCGPNFVPAESRSRSGLHRAHSDRAGFGASFQERGILSFVRVADHTDRVRRNFRERDFWLALHQHQRHDWDTPKSDRIWVATELERLQGAQEHDQILFFTGRQADMEALIVEIDDVAERIRRAVVEVRCAAWERSQNRSLKSSDVFPESGD